MICQECEEEYKFERFRFDFESGRCFGSFKCGCRVRLVLPEGDCLRLGLLDEDAREQLRHLRMVSFRLKLDKENKAQAVYLKALRAHKGVLKRYLEEVSRNSIIS